MLKHHRALTSTAYTRCCPVVRRVVRTQSVSQHAAPASLPQLATEKQFVQVLAEARQLGHVVVVDYFTQWCGPCKIIAPEIERMAAEYAEQGVKFFKVDCGADNDSKRWAMKIGIKSLPTFRVYKQEEQAGEVVGTKTQELRALIDAQLPACV